MARLSRQETQAKTHEDLLSAAVEHFLDRGYAAASLEQIADDAGYSKGAVYSNFANKDQLCAEVLGRIRLGKIAEIATGVLAGGDLEAALQAFADWAERTIGDTRWTLLEIEFAVRLRHNEQMRASMAAGAAAIRALLASQIQALAEANSVAPQRDPEESALLILSVGVGLGLQRAIDPDLSVDALVQAVREALLPAPANG